MFVALNIGKIERDDIPDYSYIIIRGGNESYCSVKGDSIPSTSAGSISILRNHAIPCSFSSVNESASLMGAHETIPSFEEWPQH